MKEKGAVVAPPKEAPGARPTPRTARRKRPERVVIDDTLATEALFDLTPEEVLARSAPNPEGERIGEAAAVEILRRLRDDGTLEDDVEEAGAPRGSAGPMCSAPPASSVLCRDAGVP